MKEKTYYLVSLGCAKNTVDSQSIETLLQQAGYTQVERPGWARFLIVNTCGFIAPARQESIQVLRDLAARKHKGQILIAAGCLPQYLREKIAEQVPGVDGILGTWRWMDILELIDQLRYGQPHPAQRYRLPDAPTIGSDEKGVARIAIQGSSAYIKIADGCRRPCAFCSIPLIKGTTVSRPMDRILAETQMLQDKGIQEVILIAQDTTDYGYDLGLKDGLATLLESMVTKVPGIPWIRILYAYPGYVTDRLITIMAEHKQILHYLDMPLQHAHPDTLLRMRRPANMDWVYRTLEKMRAAMPDLALRTTFIVGYPGETEKEFQTLLDFVKEIRFDHLGVFEFSFEPDTASGILGDPIPSEVKLERVEQLMTLQQGISLEINQKFIGKTLPVLVEGFDQGLSVGRSYRDAPEIDGLVIIEGKVSTGKIIPVKVTSALAHDLIGYVNA